MKPTEPRVEPAKLDELEGEARQLLEGTLRDGRVLNVFGTLVRHPKLFKRWSVFANHVLFKSSLPGRDREVLILRTGWRNGSDYEWSQHAVIGEAEGLTDEEVRRTVEPAEAWDGFDGVLIRAADELIDDRCLSDETWAALAERYDTHQILDVIFTVGNYTLLSMALNSCGVQVEPDVEGFPT